MALFKKKISYTDYVGNFVVALIESADKDTRLPDTENTLSEAEHQKIAKNILPFSMVILLLELTTTAHTGKGPVIPPGTSSEDINSLVARHLTSLTGEIYTQLGHSKKDYQDLVDSMMPYLDVIENANEDDLQNGVDFIATNFFATYILGEQDYSDERQLAKRFVAFDIAKQVCKNTQKAYRNYAKDFAIASM